MQIKKTSILLRAIALALMSILFLLVFSPATSPLSQYYGSDSAFFTLVGQGMTKGMLPYRDFFDMKGPFLFLIEYIGQLICYGRIGAFIMQCINLFVCLCLIDIIYHSHIGNVKFSFVYECFFMLPFFVLAISTFEGGNLTEEYSLPWLLLAVYFALKYIKQSKKTSEYKHPLRIGFYYGFAFGVLALIRITNAAMIGAIILTIAVGLLVKKEIKNLLLNGVAFIAGCVVAFIPFCLFYAWHGLLDEMLSQVFLFGIQYSTEASFSEKLTYLMNRYGSFLWWSLLPLAVTLVYRLNDWRYWLLSLAGFLLFFVAVTMGNAYGHYFTLGLPNLIMGCSLLQEQLSKTGMLPFHRWNIKKSALLVILVWAISLQSWHIQWWSNVARDELSLTKAGILRGHTYNILDIKSQIPESDYDRVYVYGMESCSEWYIQAGLLPSHRYCDWQEHYIALNPKIGDELTAWLQAESPKWIVIPIDYTIAPQQIADAIDSHYHVYTQNDAYILLVANGTGYL